MASETSAEPRPLDVTTLDIAALEDLARAHLESQRAALEQAIDAAPVLAVSVASADGDAPDPDDAGIVGLALGEAAARGGRHLLSLDLDGYEPDLGELSGFAALLSATYDPADTLEATADALAKTLGGGPVDGAEAAACLELALQGARGLDLDEQLASIERPLLYVRRADELPLTLLARLREALPDGAALVLGTSSVRAAFADRRVALAPVDGLDAAIDDLFVAPLEAALADAPVVARAALDGLALAGGRAPLADLVGGLASASQGVDPADLLDDVIDFFDDVLVDTLGLLDDLEYLHPSFRHGVYRTTSPLLASLLRRRVESGRERAGRVHDSLGPRLASSHGASTRGVAATLHRLAQRAGASDVTRAHRAMLGFWLARAEARRLEAAIERHRDAVDPREAWIAAASPAGWPGGRRLAALGALRALGGEESERREVSALLLEADLLLAGGRADAAVAAAQRGSERALARHGEGSAEHVHALLVAARAMHAAAPVGPPPAEWDPVDARRLDARGTLDAALGHLDAESSELPAALPLRVAVHAFDADLTLDRGELRAARAPLEKAVAAAVEAFGARDPRVADHRRRLGALLAEIGELEAALVEHLDAAEILVEARHPAAPLALHGVAVLEHQLGQNDAAHGRLHDALELVDSLWAGDQPALVPLLDLLARLHEQSDDPSSARPVLERALALADATDPESPDTANLARRLAAL
ncbi:MAG: tetratricopeptide repeat protein [Acidobacteriota bacterium]